MSFPLSGSVITQTGTDNGQSGIPALAAPAGVVQALVVRFEIGGGV